MDVVLSLCQKYPTMLILIKQSQYQNKLQHFCGQTLISRLKLAFSWLQSPL
uniref:Uncharacterized protein n=1 Tax=Rhizophora mucronata TaxID=61149 RepID=A0A2P2N2F0_RHIMU